MSAPKPDELNRGTQHILVHADRSSERLRSLKYGDTFAVFDRFGDIRPGENSEEGLYFDGTRFLAALDLTLDGMRPVLLGSTVRDDNDQLIVTLTNPDLFIDGTLHLPANSLHLARKTFLHNSVLYLELHIENYSFDFVEPVLSLYFTADFKDIYEVRGMPRTARGLDLLNAVSSDSVTFGYQGLDQEMRQTVLSFSPPPQSLSKNHASFIASLAPRQCMTITAQVACARSLRTPDQVLALQDAHIVVRSEIDADKSQLCSLYSRNGQFNAWVDRSTADLHMMVTMLPTGPYPYAGIPWFNTPFGRDGLMTAWECLWIRPELAKGVLRYLASTQATDLIPEQDAEPGKILHETRNGEMAAMGEMPFRLYYGSVDSTPLFVALAGAYFARTGDRLLIEEIWPNITAALDWMVNFGDKDGDGFLEYERHSKDGLIHQGWKDADDAVFHADGSLVTGAIAMAEVQGYAYAAWIAAADLACILEHAELAAMYRAAASHVYEQFNKLFWCEELSTYALALDGDKRCCRVVSSNAGQCLFTGIATQERARRVADTLLSKAVYSGWGVRTISSNESRFNPMAYHNGSVWPHDNAIIAFGLARYGMAEQAGRIFSGLFDAAMYIDLHRMPELFCGFGRQMGEGPVLYPVACAPQAWAAASVFLLCQASLGIEVDAASRQIRFLRPSLPAFLDEMQITNLDVGGVTIDLDITRHGADVTIALRKSSHEVSLVLTR